MDKRLQLGLITAACIAIVVTAWLWLNPSHQNRALSCRNELYDSGSDYRQHYMQADFILLKSSARIYYRYFSSEGKPLGHIMMTGKLLSASGSPLVYQISIDNREVTLLTPEQAMPPHMAHLAQTSQMNISSDGSHNLSITLLEFDPQRNVAAVYFTPSNAVCSCAVTNYAS